MTAHARFITHEQDGFARILGSNPSLELLLEDHAYPFAHEAGVYLDSTSELFITSNRFCDPGSDQQRVQISKVTIGGESRGRPTVREEIDSSKVPLGNGGVNYEEDKVLFCAQGSHDLPSGLYSMKTTAPHEVSLVVSGFHNRPFSSVNDVIIHSDGTIWFTDPPYGFEQGYRPRMSLPSQVYKYNPKTKNIRAMADGFGHPNGLCFSPDEKTLYVTDTDRYHGSGTNHDDRASTM
jgi:gluconolactonase